MDLLANNVIRLCIIVPRGSLTHVRKIKWLYWMEKEIWCNSHHYFFCYKMGQGVCVVSSFFRELAGQLRWTYYSHVIILILAFLCHIIIEKCVTYIWDRVYVFL